MTRWRGAYRHGRRGGGMKLAEKADNGAVTGHEPMLIAHDVASVEVALAAAAADVARVIDKAAGH